MGEEDRARAAFAAYARLLAVMKAGGSHFGVPARAADGALVFKALHAAVARADLARFKPLKERFRPLAQFSVFKKREVRGDRHLSEMKRVRTKAKKMGFEFWVLSFELKK
jgi:hypothetical protein